MSTSSCYTKYSREVLLEHAGLLWTNGAESYRENVLDSAKTLSGLFSGYLTYILVVTSGGRDGYPVQNSTNSSNVSSPLAFPVVLIFITNNTRQL